MTERHAALSEALEQLEHHEPPSPALARELEQDPALRETLVEQLATDRLIRTRVAPPTADLVARVMGAIRSQPEASAAVGKPAARSATHGERGPARVQRSRPRPGAKPPWQAALAAAAVLLALGALGLGLWPGSPERPVGPRPQAAEHSSSRSEPTASPASPTPGSAPPRKQPTADDRLAAFTAEVGAALRLSRLGEHQAAGRHLTAAWALRETAGVRTLIEISEALDDRPTERFEALLALCDRLRATEEPKLAAWGEELHRRWSGERANHALARRGDQALARQDWREAHRAYAKIERDSPFYAARQASDLRCRAELAKALRAEGDRLLAEKQHEDALAKYREAIAIAPPQLLDTLTARRQVAERQLAEARQQPEDPKKPKQADHRLLVIGSEGSEAGAVAGALRALAGAAVEVDVHVCGGPLLMASYHHPAHKPATLAALRKAERYSHVLIVDSAVAGKYPEFHFEGVLQIQRRVRALGGRPLLLQLPGPLAQTAELAYRIGRGTTTGVAPAGFVQRADARAPRADCAAAAALAAIYAGRCPITHPLVAKANGVFTRQDKAKHFDGPYTAKGRVHLLPLPMPPAKRALVIRTGTSTEAAWQKSLQPMMGVRVTRLKNDDEQRSFGPSDLAQARPIFARSPHAFAILFARAYGVDAAAIRGADQRFLQCQIYSKVEPVTDVLSLEEVAKRVFHAFEVVSKYEQARQYDLSFIPLHVALARVFDERPKLMLSKNNDKPTRPFLDMLAAMSVTSRTGEAPAKIVSSSMYCVGVGARVVRQLAHLTATGSAGFDGSPFTFVHCEALAASLEGRIDVPLGAIRTIETQRSDRSTPTAKRKELAQLLGEIQRLVAEQRARIDRIRGSDPLAMVAELDRLAERYAGTRLGDSIARDAKALKRSGRFRSETKLHATWLKAQAWVNDRAPQPGPKRVALVEQVAPQLRALCQRYEQLPLSQTILAWLLAEGAKP